MSSTYCITAIRGDQVRLIRVRAENSVEARKALRAELQTGELFAGNTITREAGLHRSVSIRGNFPRDLYTNRLA